MPIVPVIVVVVLVDGAVGLLVWAIWKSRQAGSNAIIGGPSLLALCQEECMKIHPYGSPMFDACVNKCYQAKLPKPSGEKPDVRT